MMKTLLFYQPAQHGVTPKESSQRCARSWPAGAWSPIRGS